MQPNINDLTHWAYHAGKILHAGFGQKHRIQFKGVIDLVTEIDHQSEAYLVEQIRSRFPDDLIITEEAGRLAGNQEKRWYIDPVDGTVNYAHGVPMFCVTLAYAEGDQVKLGVIYDPMRDECYTAVRGEGAFLNGERLQVSNAQTLIGSLLATGFPYDRQTTKDNNLDHFSNLTMLSQGVRRLGSAALDLAYIAAGRLDGFWELKIGPYDIAAGALMVEEAGGVVTNFYGQPGYMDAPCSIVAGPPVIHALMMEAFKPIQ